MLEQAPAVLVLDGGHPVGVLTRTDVLTFLSPGDGPEWVSSSRTGSASRPARSTPARSPTPRTGAVVPPITLSHDVRAGRPSASTTGYEYARSGNPTRTALETCVASLEGRRARLRVRERAGGRGRVLRTLVRPGDHASSSQRRVRRHVPADLEGARRRRHRVDARSTSPISTRSRRDVAATTRVLVWLETPTNPLLTIVDIEAVAQLAHEHGARCRRRQHVRHAVPAAAARRSAPTSSCTRRRSTSAATPTSSAASSRVDDDELAERLRFLQNAAGAVPAPFDCYLVLRGVKTLAVRMERHCANARAIVDLLVGHPTVERVLYPQLPDHPGHAAAAKQMRDFGGMVSLHVRGRRGGRARGRAPHAAVHAGRVARRGRVAHRAPGQMTHASAAGSPLEVDRALVRLSVGIESAADLVADLAQALDAL